MHAILTSVGTDGDVFPYVGLGAELRARGHRVTLAASGGYRAVAEEHDLELRELVTDRETEELLSNPHFWRSPLRSARAASRWGVRRIEHQYGVLSALASDGDAVLVASPAVFAARLVEEKLSRPIATLILQPWMIPSISAPPAMPGMLALPRWAPSPAIHLYWRLIHGAGDLLVGRHLNRLRARLGLEPVRRVFDWWLSPDLVAGMFPAEYGPPQADWPRQVRLAGFPIHDGRDDELPADLLAFCRAGDPPVAFTFGTGMMDAADRFEAALEASRTLGVHAVLLTKYPRQLPRALPPSVIHCAFAPLRRLLPLCAALVHHGGVGTTARALGAGTPQLILPLAFDQVDNALRVERLGAGAWIRPRQVSARRVAETLARLLAPDVKERCRGLAGRFDGANGLATAAQWIEELAERGRSAARGSPPEAEHRSEST